MNTTIYGRITKDIALKSFTKGDGTEGYLCNFTVAVANRYGSKTKTSFVNCVAFGTRAQAIVKHMGKGSEIVAHGYFEQEEYISAENKLRAWKMTITEFEFCGKKPETQPATPDEVEVAVEDIPFDVVE